MVTESLQSLLEHEEAPAEFDQPSQAPQDDFVLAEDEQEQNEKPAAKDPPKDEPKVEAPKVESTKEIKDDPAKVPFHIASMMDDRRRRQAAEARVAELERALPKADLYEDPDRYIDERIRPVRDELFESKLELMQIKHPDFDQVAIAFLEASSIDPSIKDRIDALPLNRQLQAIYKEGKYHMVLGPHDGDIDKLIDSRIGESKKENLTLKQQLQAAQQEIADLKKHKAELDEVPRSLNSAPSASRPRVEEEDDEDFGSMTVNKF